MKSITKLLDSISIRKSSDKFRMFISHIGEHIDRDTEVNLDKETYLISWINGIQKEEDMTTALAHEIAAWINQNTSRRAA